MKPDALLVPLLFIALSCEREPVGRKGVPPPVAPLGPRSHEPPASVKNCGSETNVHGQGYDQPARDCFWNAFEQGKPAYLSITAHTVEGDPMRYELEIASRSEIKLLLDSRDRFGKQGAFRHRCQSLLKEPRENGRYAFKLLGCEPPGEPELSIP